MLSFLSSVSSASSSADLEVLALFATYAIHSTLLFAAAWLLTRASHAPALRELVWKGALVGALATTALQTQVASGPLAIHFSDATPSRSMGAHESGAQARVLGLEVPGGLGLAGLPDAQPSTKTGSEAVASSLESATMAAAASSTQPVSKVTRLAPSLLLVWLVAVALGLAHFLFQHAKLRRTLATKTRVPRGPLLSGLRALAPGVALYESDRIASPLVLSRRAICVPTYALEELDETSHTAMLAHEVEHLRRRDGAWLLFAMALQIVFPFQPLIRLAIVRMRQDAELLCDEGAVLQTGDGLALARCLATVAERYSRPALPTWSAAMAATPSELVHRVERALAKPTKPLRRRRVVTTAALGIAALAVLACAGPRATTLEATSPGEDAAAPDVQLVETALANVTDTTSELALLIHVTKPGVRYHTGLNGGEPTILFESGHKGPSVWVGRETECVAAGVPFASDAMGQASLASFLSQTVPVNPERKVTIRPQLGAVYADVVPVLDQVIAAGFVDIGFEGSYSDGQGGLASMSDRIPVQRGTAQTLVSGDAAKALGGLGYVDSGPPAASGLRWQTGLEESDGETLRGLGYLGGDNTDEVADKLQALGYAEEPVEPEEPLESEEDSLNQKLAALGYLEAPEDDSYTGPGEFGGYMEIDGKLEPFYVEIGEPEFNSDPPLPDPAFTIHIDKKGTISIDGKVLVAADSIDLKPLRAELVKRAKALKHKPIAEGSNFMIADESVLISMAMTTPFRRALFVYQQFGRRDIAIVKAQFNFGSTDKEPGQLFSVPLPLDADVAVEEGQEPAPRINLYASISGIKLVTPDGAVLQRTHQEIQSGMSQDLSDALVAAAKKWSTAPIILFARGEVPSDPIAGLLAFARHEDLSSRIQFSGYFPE